MTPHNLNILLGLSTVGFVVVSLLYMIHLHDTKWKMLSKDNKIRHLESELRHYSSLYFSGCGCKKNHAHTEEAESKPQEKADRGWFSSLLKMGILAAIAYLAYFLYKKYKQRSKPVPVTTEVIN